VQAWSSLSLHWRHRSSARDTRPVRRAGVAHPRSRSAQLYFLFTILWIISQGSWTTQWETQIQHTQHCFSNMYTGKNRTHSVHRLITKATLSGHTHTHTHTRGSHFDSIRTDTVKNLYWAQGTDSLLINRSLINRSETELQHDDLWPHDVHVTPSHNSHKQQDDLWPHDVEPQRKWLITFCSCVRTDNTR